MKAPLDNQAKEIDYFRLIFGDTVMENLVRDKFICNTIKNLGKGAE